MKPQAPDRLSSALNPTTHNISWLEGFLRKTQLRYWTVYGLSAILNAVLALALFGAMLAGIRYGYPKFGSYHVAWLGGLCLAGLYLLWAFWEIFQQLREAPIAEQVEEWNSRASGFLTAIELGRALPSLEQRPLYSQRLSQARIDQVASTMKALHPIEIVPFQGFRKRAYAFIGLALGFFALLSFFPKPFSDTLGAFFYPPTSAKANPLLRSERHSLVVGDLKLTYRYPAYSGKPPRTIHNSDGSLSALKGTKVLLQARALFPIKRAAIQINNKTYLRLQVADDKRTLSGQLDLLKPGFYRFILFDKSEAMHRGPTHPIQLQGDEHPKVKMLWPKQDMELQSQKSLRIAYRFTDDFGISKIYLVYRNTQSKRLKKPERKLLREFTRFPRGGTGQTSWDLQSLPFSPGDRIAYYIEVQDNDTISGPKVSRSETRHVKLYSPLKQHDKLVAEQEKLLKMMTHFLGDLIEQPKAQQSTLPQLQKVLSKLNQKGRLLLRGFDALLPAMRKDDMAQPYVLISLENLRKRFGLRQHNRVDLTKRLSLLRQRHPYLKRDVHSNHQAELPMQEDDVYAFSLLLNRQQLDILTHLARQLTQSQNRLSDLLESYKKKRDEETKRALLREMDRMEKLMREINRRMRKLRRTISDEFLNMNAFRKKHNVAQLQAMRQMIQKGDVEEAAKRLSKLARNIERMVSQMDRFAKEAGGGLVSRMAAAMQKMIDDLHQLEQKQQRLAERTQQMRRKLLKRMQKALSKKLDKLLKKQLQRTQKIKGQLKQIQQQMGHQLQRYRYHISMQTLQHRIKQLERLLKHKDISESLQTLRRFQSRAYRLRSDFAFLDRVSRSWQGQNRRAARSSQSRMRSAMRTADKIQKDLEKIFPDPKPYMKPKDKKLMQRYQKYQRMLRKEAQRLRQRMTQMSRRMPMFKRKMGQQLQRAEGQMQRASRRLGQKSPRPAYRHQQKAISELRKLRKSMQKSMRPQGQSRRGRRGRRQRGQRGGRRGHMRNMREQKVKIPKPGQHKAPKALRQDILDAMKEKLPHRYREPVKRYYEKLVK